MSPSIVISGSYRKHFERIIDCKIQFEEAGAKVLRPVGKEILSQQGNVVRLEGDPETVEGIEAAQLRAIANSDLLYVVNPGGYLGPATTLEIGYAYRAGLPIITSETPYEAALITVISSTGNPALALEFLINNGR